MLVELIATLERIFLDRSHADKAIEKSFKEHPRWGARDRKFFAENIYDFVRWWRKIWFLTGEFPEGNVDPEKITPEQWEIFVVTGFLMKDLPPAEFEALDTEQVIERYQKQNKKLKEASRAVRQSLPDELDAYGSAQLKEDWPAILSALNQKAKTYLRVNTLKIDRDSLQAKLKEEGVETVPVPDVPSALMLVERKNVFVTKSFHEGLFELQDAASQMVAPLLNPQPGERIFDACAGGGGKSLHLAALMKNKGKILAFDIHEWKLKELKLRARRNSVDIVETRWIDSTKVIKRLEGQADGVLLDVPCSGSGVLKRNPDAKWKLNIPEIEKLKETQKQILQSYSSLVKSKGRLVYATCSVFPDENQQQVQKFLENNSQMWRLEKEIVVLPHIQNYDGFYAALLVKI
ncbi:MAG: methyltransferase domain-containing protein [Bdellovibrionota bacterium]